jgi:hypothetical protein
MASLSEPTNTVWSFPFTPQGIHLRRDKLGIGQVR